MNMRFNSMIVGSIAVLGLSLVVSGCGGGGSGSGSASTGPAPTGVNVGASSPAFLVSPNGSAMTFNSVSSTFSETPLIQFSGSDLVEMSSGAIPTYLLFNGSSVTYGPLTGTGGLPLGDSSYSFQLQPSPSNVRVKTDGVFYLSAGNIWEYSFALKQNIMVRNNGGDCSSFDVAEQTGGNTHLIAEVVKDPSISLDVDFVTQSYSLSGSAYTAGPFVVLSQTSRLTESINGCAIAQDGSAAVLGFDVPGSSTNLVYWSNASQANSNSNLVSDAGQSGIKPLAISPSKADIVFSETSRNQTIDLNKTTGQNPLNTGIDPYMEFPNSTGTDY